MSSEHTRFKPWPINRKTFPFPFPFPFPDGVDLQTKTAPAGVAFAAVAVTAADLAAWREVLDGIDEIKAGGGIRVVVEPKTEVARARIKTGLFQSQFAALMGVSKLTLEQWEQGRREPSRAAKTLIRIADLRPDVLKDITV